MSLRGPAALASYAIAYRFYARFITRKVLGVDDKRATPAERLRTRISFERAEDFLRVGAKREALAASRVAIDGLLGVGADRPERRGMVAADLFRPVGED